MENYAMFWFVFYKMLIENSETPLYNLTRMGGSVRSMDFIYALREKNQ